MSQDLSNIDIPVIGPESSREELLTYIRILEARLEIDSILEVEPGRLLGPHGFEEQWVPREVSQERRVQLLRDGLDAVSLRDVAAALCRCNDDDQGFDHGGWFEVTLPSNPSSSAPGDGKQTP